ncbi:MAG: pyridoxal-phosphate dependent enzyme, partial [Rhodospirillaceae bacterium]|nr:pyridoxal-phosphate dependent enzyme [Rhodospirillaceae bacterium]
MQCWQNITEQRPTFVSHLECGLSGEQVPSDQLHGLSSVGRPFLVRYDLPSLGRSLSKETLAARPPDMWRYREFLPVRNTENILSLGECMTPMLPAPGVDGDLWIKDEGRLPTGSFKARGLCLAVSMAKELGIKRMAMPTNGNAGAAMAAYCRQ